MTRNYLICIVILSCSTIGQGQSQDSTSLPRYWSFTLSGFYYYVPHDENFLSLIGEADFKKFHFEGRYNYEDSNTGSVFVGYTFEGGNVFHFEVIPMFGGVFGNTKGVAPGLALAARFGKFDYYSETEYLFNSLSRKNDFLYTWGELAFNPSNHWRLGISYQRTLLYETGLDIQRGVMFQYTIKRLTLGTYYFNPFTSDNLLIALLTVEF